MSTKCAIRKDGQPFPKAQTCYTRSGFPQLIFDSDLVDSLEFQDCGI
jgi:hypothetical protein